MVTRRKFCGSVGVAALTLLAGCGGDDNVNTGPTTATRDFTFASNTEGWTAGFADLPVNANLSIYELNFAYTALPTALAPGRSAPLISGHNRSDDLFMFLKRRITGLSPNTRYDIRFDIQIASNAPSESAGIGGAPGTSVYLKAGASLVEPVPVTSGEDLRLNIDKGQQSEGGRDMIVLGNIGIPGDQAVYAFKSLDNSATPFAILTDSSGAFWSIVGTDSGFEGLTNLYYTNIRLTLTPIVTS